MMRLGTLGCCEGRSDLATWTERWLHGNRAGALFAKGETVVNASQTSKWQTAGVAQTAAGRPSPGAWSALRTW